LPVAISCTHPRVRASHLQRFERMSQNQNSDERAYLRSTFVRVLVVQVISLVLLAILQVSYNN
jgi:hypothetical protein